MEPKPNGKTRAENYKDLLVWQKAMDLAVAVYQVTRKFPDVERFGLVMQLRRAAVSVPSNIAEGQARFSRKDFRRFLGMALGSLFEVETQMLLARRLEYVKNEEYRLLEERLHEIARMIRGLVRKLPQNSP